MFIKNRVHQKPFIGEHVHHKMFIDEHVYRKMFIDEHVHRKMFIEKCSTVNIVNTTPSTVQVLFTTKINVAGRRGCIMLRLPSSNNVKHSSYYIIIISFVCVSVCDRQRQRRRTIRTSDPTSFGTTTVRLLVLSCTYTKKNTTWHLNRRLKQHL